MNPTFSGFIEFLRNQVQVSEEAMPTSSPSAKFAYEAAIEIVNTDIQKVMPALYLQAVYNLATSFLVNFGIEEIFAVTRKNLGLNTFSPGPVTQASDNGTSASRLVPDFYKNLSLLDLQMLKDPFGRIYLSIAQQFGSLWVLG